MTSSLSRPAFLAQFLACPDDGGALIPDGASWHCESCGRAFHAARPSVIDMLPRQPVHAGDDAENGNYWTHYQSMFGQRMLGAEATLPWGAPERLSDTDMAHKRNHVAAVRKLLAKPSRGNTPSILCDLTGGSGHYTLALAGQYDHVFHCDLDPASLLYTAQKAESSGLRNMTFLRVDYLQPPFRGSIGDLLCLDTLIRGPEHELRLLRSIRGVLRPGGRAVVDFHNWWHNPLRRLGLLKENFRDGKSYNVLEAKRLLEAAGYTDYDYASFRQEIARSRPASTLLRIIPPTRLMFRLSANASPEDSHRP